MYLQFFVDSLVEKFPYLAIRSNYSCPNTQLRSIRTELAHGAKKINRLLELRVDLSEKTEEVGISLFRSRVRSRSGLSSMDETSRSGFEQIVVLPFQNSI